MKTIIAFLIAIALTGCAMFDAAHIEGQKADASKYKQYSDVELAKQNAVAACFARANTDNQLAYCALFGQSVGMASTFGGRPTGTNIAPTSMQALGSALETVVPYAAAAAIAKSVSNVQAKDPVVVQQAAPVIVEPFVIEVPAK